MHVENRSTNFNTVGHSGTQRRTVISLLIENAMPLRPEPLCTPVLPPCPTVLKLVVANY